MMVQAEVSLYPLRTDKLSETIDRFLGEMEGVGLKLHKTSMSSMLTGDIDMVFSALGQAFTIVAGNAQVVLILKISNACPLSNPSEGNNADAE